MLSGESFDFGCHSNLTRAIMPFGLNEFDVHDVLNVFQVTGLNVNGQYFMCALLPTDFKNLQANLEFYYFREPCPAKPGDFFEFFAEIDVLCALSTCPGGDLSQWGWGQRENSLECCRPLGVEVYKLTDPMMLQDWESPGCSSYRGMHGLVLPRDSSLAARA